MEFIDDYLRGRESALRAASLVVVNTIFLAAAAPYLRLIARFSESKIAASSRRDAEKYSIILRMTFNTHYYYITFIMPEYLLPLMRHYLL